MTEELKENTFPIGDGESNLDYVNRVTEALMANLKIKGVLIAVTSPAGNYFITSKGTPPPLAFMTDDHWMTLDR